MELENRGAEVVRPADRMAESGRLEASYRTDSYIFAIERNGIPILPYQATGDSQMLILSGGRMEGPLSERQLEEYRQHNFWVRLTWALWEVWLLWTALQLLLSPRCTQRPNKWWHTTVFYEVWASPILAHPPAAGCRSLRRTWKNCAA